MKIKTKSLFIGSIVCLLGGCLPPPSAIKKSEENGLSTNAAYPKKFRVNGNAVLTQGASLKNPIFKDLPPIKSIEDYDALIKLTRRMASLSADYAKKQDIQNFVETWYFTQQLASYVAQIKFGSDSLVNSLKGDSTGKIIGEIQENSIAVIPIDKAIGPLNTGLPPGINKVSPPTGGLGDLILQNPNFATPSVNELPERVAVSLPNGVALYRNGGILYIVNKSPQKQTIPLSDAGWSPPPLLDSKTASTGDIARLKIAMDTNLNNWFWNKIYTKRKNFYLECKVKQPGYAGCTDGERATFAVDGSWAKDDDGSRIAQTTYYSKQNSAFHLAVDDLAKRNASEDRFKSQCFRAVENGSYVQDDVISGSAAQFETYRCWYAPLTNGNLGNFSLVYSQQYINIDNKTLRTEASLLEDKRLIERLKSVNERNKVAVDLVGFIPGLSNIENGAKCAGGAEWSPTVLLINSYVKKTNQAEYFDQMANNFVGYTTPAMTDIDRGLSCVFTLTPGAWKKVGDPLITKGKVVAEPIIKKAKDAYEAAINNIAFLRNRAANGSTGVAQGDVMFENIMLGNKGRAAFFDSVRYAESPGNESNQAEPYVAILAATQQK